MVRAVSERSGSDFGTVLNVLCALDSVRMRETDRQQ